MGAVLFFILLACSLYKIVLLARIILDLVQILVRDWRPEGLILIVANLVYRLTEPPLRFLRKYIPPVRVGAVAFDVGFLLLFFGVSIFERIVSVVFSLL